MFGIFKKKEEAKELTFTSYEEVLTFVYNKELACKLKMFFASNSLIINDKVTTPDLFYVIINDVRAVLTLGDVRSLLLDNREDIYDYAKDIGCTIEELQILTKKTNDLI